MAQSTSAQRGRLQGIFLSHLELQLYVVIFSIFRMHGYNVEAAMHGYNTSRLFGLLYNCGQLSDPHTSDDDLSPSYKYVLI